MTRHTKLLLTSLAATAILAMAVSSASANRLSINNSRLWRTTWTSLNLIVNARSVLCPVTLEGSFHSATISKVEGALIGYITRPNVTGASCTGGSMTFFQETLPWHVRYRGFSGTLPNITLLTIGIIGMRFRIKLFGEAECNATTLVTRPMVDNIPVNSGVVEALIPERNTRIPLEGGLCPFAGEGAFEGASMKPVEVPSGGAITVTLI